MPCHLPPLPLQAGIVTATLTLLRSAGGPSGGPSGPSGGASTSDGAWRAVLRGVGAAALAPEVRRLGAALHRIASVSVAVAGPAVYAPLLSTLRGQLPARQRRRH